MWTDNEYGGEGGFDTNNFASPSQADNKAAGSKSRSIAPVTINMVLDCPEEGLKVRDIDIQVVQICGIVKAVEVSSIKVTYKIEDCTGEISGASYLESDAEASVPVVENSYCIMIGSIRSQQNEKHIMIFNIYPITNINEIFEHSLAVVHLFFKAEQMSRDISVKQEMIKEEAISSSGFGGSEGHNFDMNPKFKRVFDTVSRCRTESGLSFAELEEALPIKMPASEIKAALEHLINEGHVFTTIDDNHYKSTDS